MMEEKWKIYALLIAMSVVCVASAAVEPEEFDLPAVNESEEFVSPALNESGEETLCCSGIVIPICVDEGDQRFSDISENRVAWINEDAGKDEIWMYDLLTSSKTLLLKTPTNKFDLRIDGDYIVWAQNSAIYIYCIPTGTVFPVSDIPDACQIYPEIDGSRIVWVDDRLQSGDTDIYMYDFLTGIETAVCTDPLVQLYPAISGDRIVWEDWSHDPGGQIYLYDMTTGVTEVLCPSAPRVQLAVGISGDYVAWTDADFGVNGPYNCDVKFYDFSTGTASWICNRSGEQYFMSIDGDEVLYCEFRVNGSKWRDFYIYDLSTGEEELIYTDEGPLHVENARIDGGRVVFTQKEGANYDTDIYLYMPFFLF